MRTDGKNNKRTWEQLRIGKVSNVGSPAQAPAVATIIKSQKRKTPEDYMSKLFKVEDVVKAMETALGKEHELKGIDEIAKKFEATLAEITGIAKEDMEIAKSYFGLPVEERDFYLSLDETAREDFLKADAESRKTMKKAAEKKKEEEWAKKSIGEEEVVFEGISIKKSENETAFLIAKRMQEKEVELTRKTRIIALAKTASKDYANVAGTDEEKAEVLAHIEDLEDGVVKKSLSAILTSHNALIEKSGLFDENGVNSGDASDTKKGTLRSLIKAKYDKTVK